jgi:hypothetical protein
VTSEGIAPATSWARRFAVGGLVVNAAAVVFILAVDVVLMIDGRPGQAAFALLPLFLIIDL